MDTKVRLSFHVPSFVEESSWPGPSSPSSGLSRPLSSSSSLMRLLPMLLPVLLPMLPPALLLVLLPMLLPTLLLVLLLMMLPMMLPMLLPMMLPMMLPMVLPMLLPMLLSGPPGPSPCCLVCSRPRLRRHKRLCVQSAGERGLPIWAVDCLAMCCELRPAPGALHLRAGLQVPQPPSRGALRLCHRPVRSRRLPAWHPALAPGTVSWCRPF